MKSIKCFYAYPNKMEIKETIIRGISLINQSPEIKAKSWEEMNINGGFIPKNVFSEIDDCDLFICDLTFINHNVLFELGYAISKNKKIWLSLDSSLNDSKEKYKKLKLLTTIGHSEYTNSQEIADKFFLEKPFEKLNDTIYNTIMKQIQANSPSRQTGIFYLKSAVVTDASIDLSNRLKSFENLIIVTDDPTENTANPLTWYVENIHNSKGTIVHFIDDNRSINSNQDAKYALVSGMAYGFEKTLLMLAHAPFNEPIDYRDMVKVHENTNQCVQYLDSWINQISLTAAKKKFQVPIIKPKASLHKIILGEYTAENEEEELSNYFVETAEYNEALNTKNYTIYLGRKGSGKTANLYQIVEKLSADIRNFVCIVKPIDYQFEGILQLFSLSISRATKGYLVETLWKYLVYTELAANIYTEIKGYPINKTLSSDEQGFINYVDENKDIILQDFSVRLEKVIHTLCGLDFASDIEKEQKKISEILHSQLLTFLVDYLANILSNRYKVYVLVDNLDKAWQKREDLTSLSDFLFGLLSAGQSISNEFGKKNYRRMSVNLSLIIYLRSDIFSYISRNARERDKLTYRRIKWNDPQMLQKVIERRFTNSLGNMNSSIDIWETFFTGSVDGIPTQDYIISRIIPRPRDIIFLCRYALRNAINRDHIIIDELDIKDAEKEYSNHAFDALIVELEVEQANIERLLIEFAGENEIIDREKLTQIFSRASLVNSDHEKVIERLCDYSFLGREISPNKFDFAYDESRKEVLRIQAQKVASETGVERYKINTPFHAYLGIDHTA